MVNEKLHFCALEGLKYQLHDRIFYKKAAIQDQQKIVNKKLV